MAEVSATRVTPYSTIDTSTTGANPAHTSGKYLVARFAARVASANFTTPTQDGGWTAIGTATNGSMTVAWFYIKTTGSSMAAPVSTHTSAQYRVCTVHLVEDGDLTNFIDTGFGTSGFASSYASNTNTAVATSPSGTTVQNNVLLIQAAMTDELRHLELEPGPTELVKAINIADKLQEVTAWTFQETAGAIETFDYYATRSATDVLSSCIAIRSESGLVPARQDLSTSPATIMYAGNQDGDGNLAWTDTAVASDLGTIDSISTNDASFSKLAGSGLNPYNTSFFVSSSTAGEIATQHFLLDSGVNYDCSNSKISFGIMLADGLSVARIESIESHGVMVGLTSGTSPKEIAMWDAGGFETGPLEVQSIVVDDNTAITHEVQTFDFTDVRGFVIGIHLAVASATKIALDYVHRLGTIVLRGGNSTYPASWSTAYKIARSCGLKTIEKLGNAYRTKHDIQIGGANDVYFDSSGESLFVPVSGSIVAQDLQFQAADVSVTIKVTAGSTVRMTDPDVGNNNLDFTVHADSSSSATYLFTGSMATPKSVTLNDIGAGAYGGYTFLDFPEITHNNADLTGGVTFDGCTGTQAITITGATEGALQTALDLLAGATFQNSTTYGLTISFTGTGNVSLNAPSNLTVDELLYTSTNASGLTIVVGSSGSSFPSTATGGSATGVTISNDKTLTLNINVTGAEVTLLEDGTATEVDHTETATTTYTYTYTYSSDEAIDIQVYKPGYKPYWNGSVTLGNADQSITVDLETEVAYG